MSFQGHQGSANVPMQEYAQMSEVRSRRGMKKSNARPLFFFFLFLPFLSSRSVEPLEVVGVVSSRVLFLRNAPFLVSHTYLPSIIPPVRYLARPVAAAFDSS